MKYVPGLFVLALTIVAMLLSGCTTAPPWYVCKAASEYLVCMPVQHDVIEKIPSESGTKF